MRERRCPSHLHFHRSVWCLLPSTDVTQLAHKIDSLTAEMSEIKELLLASGKG